MMWKEILDKVRRYIEIAIKGKDEKLCKPWLAHWDY